MRYRIDVAGSLGTVERTPQGGLRVPAALTRSGIFSYLENGKEVLEYRPPEEVSDPESLATLRDAPVTDTHPPVPVTAANWDQYARGNVSGDVTVEGDKLVANLAIQGKNLLSAVENRARTEVSCGYQCEIDNTPGVTPDGQRFDRIQRRIRYNHVAIVEQGRAGAEVALRLDSNGDCPRSSTPQTQDRPPMIFRIDGVDYNVSVDGEAKAALVALTRLDARVKDLTDKAAKVEADLAVARADAAAQKTRADTAENPARVAEAVKARVALEAKAVSILGKDFRCDALTDSQVQAAVIDKSFPGLRKDAAGSEAYNGALYDAAVKRADEQEQADPDGLAAVRTAADDPAPRTDAADSTPEAARARMVARQGKTKAVFAVSKK